jgi:hypothetical protein
LQQVNIVPDTYDTFISFIIIKLSKDGYRYPEWLWRARL